ncbi:MAG: aminotransferase class V-fold PLP-dependent enzyme [Pseudomonadota bacterium]
MSEQQPVYLDYAATTPVDPRVAECLARHLKSDGAFANPSAIHIAGRKAAGVVQRATLRVAELLNCDPKTLVFTSGATESDNLAILGAAAYRADRGRHVVSMPTEHKAVVDAFRALEKRGFDVSWIEPSLDGRLDLGAFAASLRDDTQLVSIMHVNNETGVIQDIAAIGAICRERDVLLHVDAAQSAGKLGIDLAALPVDLLSLTAHKMYGPKGIGALYIADRPGCHVEPQLFGGGQQRRLRPGTLPVPLIAAFGEAARLARDSMPADRAHVEDLAGRLWQGLAGVQGVSRNGSADHCWPGILNVSVDDIEGESLMLALEPVCVATGSACNSQNQDPSYVLRALGLGDLEAQSAIRFSFGRMTTTDDIDVAVERYRGAVEHLRRIAPERAA